MNPASPSRWNDVWVGHFRDNFPTFAAAFPSADLMPNSEHARAWSVSLNKRLAHLTATRCEEADPAMSYYDGYFDGVEIVRFQAALPHHMQQVISQPSVSGRLSIEKRCNCRQRFRHSPHIKKLVRWVRLQQGATIALDLSRCFQFPLRLT